MSNRIVDMFKIPELKNRILITLGILAACRLGASIPTPGVDGSALQALFKNQQGTLFGFLDMFSGGALNKLSVFSLGVMPYINASIIMSLLQTVVPYLEKLAKEGESGRKKITQLTRYGTLAIGAIQAYGLTFWMQSMKAPNNMSIVISPGLQFQLLTVLTLVTGTMVLMWLGEQITEKGVGNGISLIIFTGIIHRLPGTVKNMMDLLRQEEISIVQLVLVAVLVFAITAFVVFVEQAQRKIPVQYAKRVVGRKIYGGQNTYLPLKVDQSGVIAVIFASAVLLVPAQLAQFFPNIEIVQKIVGFLSPGKAVYELLSAGLIIFFCYFYTAITFNPNDLAENMKKWGGFIPDIRAGTPTSQYINHVLTRITLVGALFVVAITVVPDFPVRWLKAPTSIIYIFSGTAILIVVGVGLDTIGQIESHLVMRHYDAFMKKGRIKGRYFNIK